MPSVSVVTTLRMRPRSAGLARSSSASRTATEPSRSASADVASVSRISAVIGSRASGDQGPLICPLSVTRCARRRSGGIARASEIVSAARASR